MHIAAPPTSVPTPAKGRPPSCDAGSLTEEHDLRCSLESPHRQPVGRSMFFGARPRPRRRPAPEAEAHLVVPRRTVAALQGKLYQRDMDVWTMHRQLRCVQQQILQRNLEEGFAARRLRDLLCDADVMPQLSRPKAAELGELRRTLQDLSTRYADAKSSEMQWSAVARRHLSFYVQSEAQAREGTLQLKRHPAGEVFLAGRGWQAFNQGGGRELRPQSTQYCDWGADEVVDDDEDVYEDEDDDPPSDARESPGRPGRPQLQLPPSRRGAEQDQYYDAGEDRDSHHEAVPRESALHSARSA